ncbi:MAG TPA: PAS domain-containing protein [Stellaceae bacterium]|nr:PAS domain-containing protein [Stellaceae bacterium]
MSSDLTYVIDPGALDDARFEEIRAYWNNKRGVRPMPARADIDPLELKSHLGDLLLIDVFPDLSDFRFRLLGTNITATYGRDNTGRTVREIYETSDPETFTSLSTLYRVVATARVPVRAGFSLRAVNKAFIKFDSLYLPLSSDGVAVDMILCETHFTVMG